MRKVRSSNFAGMGMYVRMYVLYVLSAGLYVCMYACIVVVIMSVVLLTSIELGFGEVENGPKSHGTLLSFGWGAWPDGVVC